MLSSLGLTRYDPVFTENEIELEDLFLLSSTDLSEMGLKIGARNRILAFQQFFRGSTEESIADLCKSNELVSSLVENSFSTRAVKFCMLAVQPRVEIENQMETAKGNVTQSTMETKLQLQQSNDEEHFVIHEGSPEKPFDLMTQTEDEPVARGRSPIPQQQQSLTNTFREQNQKRRRRVKKDRSQISREVDAIMKELTYLTNKPRFNPNQENDSTVSQFVDQPLSREFPISNSALYQVGPR